MFKNIGDTKTTFIGLALLIYAGYLQFFLFQSNVLEFNWPVGALTVVGLALILAPDTIIDALKKVIGKKTE
jgi:hypothetical protein